MSSTLTTAHLPCPDCGSSDALSLFDDGHTFCFACQQVRSNGECTESGAVKTKAVQEVIQPIDLELNPLSKRGITKETCRKYGYYTSSHNGDSCQVACYMDDDGTIIGQKLRFANKSFSTLGKLNNRFFGQHLFNGGKKLVITEGEIDCLTVSQLNGNKYPVVSIPNGCQSAKKVFNENLDWLCSFEEVIVMFDQDDPGRKAMESVCGILPPGKLKLATLPLKDPNECLLQGQADAVIKAIWNAKEYKPDGIVNGLDLWDDLINEDPNDEGFPIPWDIPLQTMHKGVRKAELIVLCAGTGVGKSTLVRGTAHHFGINLNLKIGMMMLEESAKKTAKGLMSITSGKRIDLNRSCVTDEEYRQIYDETFGNGNFTFYQHFGSLATENLLTKVRYLAVGEKCDFIILDHITIAISGLDIDNERKATDVLMTQLRSLVEETGVGLLVISHLKRTEGTPAEEGGAISLSHLRGSHALAQLSDSVWALERNQQAEEESEKNLVRLRILKNRHTGETGIAGYLKFNKETGRLEAAEKKRENIADVFKTNNDEGDF